MTENMKALVKKVMASKELQTKFAAVNSLEEAYALAASLQQGLTHEEFFNAVEQMKNSAAATAELSSEDMEKVAGGTFKDMSSDPNAYPFYAKLIQIFVSGKTNNGDNATNSSGIPTIDIF